MNRGKLLVVGIMLICLAVAVPAETIAVRRIQRPMHRFMVARSEDGKTLANGEFWQVVQGDEVTMRLTYRFLDGSMDDEETTYTQKGTFRLVRNRHIQKGPFFTKPIDFTVETSTGIVTSRTFDKSGKMHIESKRMDLPADLANGIVGTLLLNVAHNTKPFRVGMLATVGGGRLVPLLISSENEETVHLEERIVKATVFRIHPELNAFVRVFARVLGLQPKDVVVWVLQGEDPAVAVIVGQLGGYGPVVSSDLVGASFGK